MLSLWLEIIAIFSPEIVIETASVARKLNTMVEGCYGVRQLMFKCVYDGDKGISF